MARRIKILAIDGGGMRGVIPATVLMEIERRTGKAAAELFDLMAGTSTGGILAAGLAVPGPAGPRYSAGDLRELYFQEGSVIFPQPGFPRSAWNVSKRPLAEKYSPAGIEGVLQKFFGEIRLKDACSDLLIPSYEIRLRQPWFFRSARARENPAYDFALREVARATSAAPTYFPPARLARAGASPWVLIDGGTFANNPAVCAYAEARKMHPDAEILLVSLGTGRHAQPIHYRPGLLGWAAPILDIVFDGVSRTAEYQLQELLPVVRGRRQYYRFQTDLTIAGDAIDHSDPASLLRLRQQAEDLVHDETVPLTELCAQLRE
jgi:patatin-like phospholipase/acyl hydrolase